MIDYNKWTTTLPNSNRTKAEQNNQLNPQIWTNTIPKAKSNTSIKKYSFLTIGFIFGLILVSVIKNETRNLEKELNDLRTTVDEIKFNLYQAVLDHEVITSPENISKLAEKHLDLELSSYKKNQIRNLGEKYQELSQTKENKKIKISKKMKTEVVNKIAEKRVELAKLQEIYSQPEKLPEHLRTKVAKKITKTKEEIKYLYSNPKEAITLERAQRWAAVQVVKVFLGMPIIPGK